MGVCLFMLAYGTMALISLAHEHDRQACHPASGGMS